METGIKPEPGKPTPWKSLFIGALVVLGITNAVTIYLLVTEKHDKEVVIVEKENLNNEYQSVMAELDEKKADLEKLRGQNDEMDKKIDEQQKMIDDEKAQLEEQYKQNTITAAELSAARKKINEYQVSIANLQQRVTEVEGQNKQLSYEKDSFYTGLTAEKEVTAKLTTVADSLGRKVDAGSLLQIAKVNVEAIKKKNNGDEVVVEKLKSMDMLKVSFETGINKVIDPGSLNLYVRIINPRGETIAVDEQGSGVIPETASDKPVKYTKKQTIQYNQTNKKVVFYWTRYITDPGLYRVEVYQSGKVIGKGSVRLS